jgi:hypothetical protein
MSVLISSTIRKEPEPFLAGVELVALQPDDIVVYTNLVRVPEPLTILSSATALGFGAFFKRKLKSSESISKETINVGE